MVQEAFNMLQGTTAQEQQLALSIVRGSKKKATPRVINSSKRY